MSEQTRILIVEDREADFDLARLEISKSVQDCAFRRVETRQDFLDALETFQPAVILSDYSLPRFDGMTALKLAKEQAPLTPFIIWTGSLSEDVAVECMKAGASNYVLKENIKRLGSTIVHSIEERRVLVEHQRTDEALRESEARYHGIFESAQDAIFLESLEGDILDANQRACQIYGYTREEFLSKKVSDLVPSKEYIIWFNNEYDILGKPIETVNVRSNGEHFPVELSGGLYEFGEHTLFLIVLRDITERKRAEEKYQDIFEHSQEGIFQSTPDGRFIKVNPAMASIYGYDSPQDMIESITSIADQLYIEPEDRDKFTRLLQLNDHVENFEMTNVCKDGSILWTHTSARVVRDADGNILYYEGFLQDITERKLAEIKIQQRNDDIQLISAINEMALRGEGLDGIVNLLAKELKRNFSISGSTLYMLSPDSSTLTMQQYFLSPEVTRHVEKIIGSTIPLIQLPIQEGSFFQKILNSQHGSITSERDEIEKWMAEFINTPFLPPVAKGVLHNLIPQIYDLLNIRSTIAIPLMLNGKTIGLLDVSSAGLFTEDDLERIENISRQLTAAIQRQQANEQVRGSEAFLQSIQNALSASIAILNEEGVIVQVNTAWRKFGEQNGLQHPEYCIGLNYLDICDSATGADAEAASLTARSIREVIAGKRHDAQVEYACHSPEEKRWFILHVTKFDDGNHIWVVLAHENISTRKQAEEALKESSEQFRSLFEASPEAIMLINPQDNWDILDCNTAACRMNGYTRDELIGQSIDILNLTPGAPTERLGYLETIRATDTVRYEDQHRRKDGTVFPIEVSKSLITVGGREMVLGIDRDITERKKAEEALRESEALYRQAIEVAGAVPYYESYYDNGRAIKYEFIGEGIRQITGYGPEEFNAKIWDSLVEEVNLVEDLNGYSLEEGIQRVRSGENPIWKCEHRIRARDGKTHWVFEAAVELRDEHGVSHGSIGTYQDITKRKQAEEALRESEKRYRALFENMPVAIWEEDFSNVKKHLDSLNEQGITDYPAYFESHVDETAACANKIRILDVNKTAVQMFQAESKEQLIEFSDQGLSKGELGHVNELLTTIAQGGASNSWEGADETLTGEPIEISLSWSVVPGYENDYSKVIITTTDITERKRMESAEREQRALAESLRDTAEILNSTLDYGEVLDHILTAVERVVPHDTAAIMLIDNGSAYVVRAQGYDKRGLDTEIMDVVLPLSETINLRWMFETGESVVVSDTQTFAGWQKLPSSDWLRSNVGAPISIYGEVIGFILLNSETPGFFTSVHAKRLEAFANQAALAIHNARLLQQAQEEIAERKRAEEALRQSENRYRTVVENQTEFIVRWTPGGMRTFVNDAYCRYFGLTPEQALSYEFMPLVHEEDRPVVEEKITRLLLGTIRVETDVHRVLKPDGSIGWQEWTDQAINDEKGQIIEFQSVGRDITERIQAEQELRTSEERFRQLADNIQEVFWITDAINGEEIYISPASKKIWGKSAESILNTPNTFLESLLPEDRPYVLAKVEEQRSGKRTDLEYRILYPDGSVRWIWDRAFPIFDNDGRVIRLAGIAADITERKQAEDALHESEERFSTAFEFAPIGMALVSLDGHWLKVNHAICELLGYTEQELLSTTFQQVTYPDDLDADLDHVNQVLTGNIHFYQMEKRYIHKSGHAVWGLLSVSLMKDNQGKSKYFISQIQDITERKQAEEALRKNEQRLRIALAGTNIAVFNQDKDLRYTWMYQPQLGYTSEQIVGKTDMELLPPQDALNVMEIKHHAMETGKPERAEVAIHSENRMTYYDMIVEPMLDSNGTVIGLTGSTLDITDHKNSEMEIRRHLTEMEALYENGLALGRLLNPREIGERIIATFAHHLSWHHVAIRLLQPGSNELELIAFNLPGIGEEARAGFEHRFQSMINRVGQGLSGWVAQTGKPFRTGDVHVSPQYVDTYAGIQSGLYMPLKIGDQILGVISVESEEPDAFTPQDERLLATLANQAAVAFENAHLYQTNQQERERFSELFENTPVATWLEDFSAVITWMNDLRAQDVIDLKKYLESNPEQYELGVSLIKILSVNHAAVVMNGAHNKDELMEKIHELMMDKTPSQIMINELDLIWRGYTSFGFEMSSPKLDGTILTGIQRIYIPTKNSGPDYTSVIVTSTDITDRVSVENQLRTSEVHYRELADSITDIFFELDQNLCYSHWNKASETLTGLSAENAIGKSMGDVFGESDDQKRIERIYRDVLTKHQPHTFETMFSVNNQPRDFEINAYPSTRGVAVVAKDVTERKRSESLMQKRFELMEYSAEHTLQELMQKALDEISEWTHSTIGFFQFIKEDQVTPSLQVWSTDTFQHFQSSDVEKMHKPADQAGVWAEAIRSRRAVIHNDYVSISGKKGLPEGHVLLTRELVVPIIRNERIMAVIGIGNKPQEYNRDDLEITERFADYAWDIIERKQMVIEIAEERNQLAKRVEERTSDLSRANSNLARALHVKDEFLANMSHELRTPLNAILGLSESLSEQTAGPLNEKQQKYLNTISESGHHLLSLINDILDLAKIEAGQITLDINKVDVNSVSQASLRMIKQLAQKKNLDVSVKIDEKVGLMWADERRLKQMMVNLLSNAVKFTPEGGKIGLQIDGDQDENKVEITVWDTGIGIKEGDFERLFQPFVQLDSGLARETSGTGLGLALVAQMARLHGGSISVQSDPGKGSRFTILMPWEPALAADTVERMKVTGKFRAIRSGQTEQTILLIEDTPEVVMIIKDYLEIAGYKVATAQDGLDGITQAKFTHPDLILMDVQMPRMDGLEATQKLRQDPEFKYTPIIALTALAMPNDRERCIAAGMDEYISKPVNLRGLVKLIQNYIFLREEKNRSR